ncbi:pancreatic lipase-related protein 2-like isoform X2 [Periplaneta americana]
MILYNVFTWVREKFVPMLLWITGPIESYLGLPGAANCTYAQQICPNPYVTFYLYTTDHPEPRLLNPNYPDNITSSLFMTGKPIKIMLHGYNSSHTTFPNIIIGPEYLAAGNYNVIAAEFEELVKKDCYLNAMKNMPVIANCTAQFIGFLVNSLGVSLQDIHVIGFSLGAPIAGQIANYMKWGKLSRITGLEPALPPLQDLSKKPDILDKGDADFVDIIHTQIGTLGKVRSTGHVDFYVNNGFKQPSCPKPGFLCSHGRSVSYYAESITTPIGFWGYRCPDVIDATIFTDRCSSNSSILMGEYTNSSARGIYKVDTHDKPPYAMGKNRG